MVSSFLSQFPSTFNHAKSECLFRDNPIGQLQLKSIYPLTVYETITESVLVSNLKFANLFGMYTLQHQRDTSDGTGLAQVYNFALTLVELPMYHLL